MAQAPAAESGPSCEQGDMEACWELGLKYMEGNGVAKDGNKARRYFEQACDGGSLVGCNSLGVAHAKGVGGEPNPDAALCLYESTCERGLQKACYNLAAAYQFGTHGPKNLAQALKIHTRVCDDGFQHACHALAFMYLGGDGVEQSFPRAFELFESGCRGRIAKSCYNLAWEAKNVPKQHGVRSREVLAEMCSDSFAPACGGLGAMVAHGIGGPQELELAAQFLTQGCDGDDGAACTILGWMAELGLGPGDPDFARAREVYAKGCRLEEPKACANLAILFSHGGDLAPDSEEAAHFFRRACDLGEERSCGVLQGATSK